MKGTLELGVLGWKKRNDRVVTTACLRISLMWAPVSHGRVINLPHKNYIGKSKSQI